MKLLLKYFILFHFILFLSKGYCKPHDQTNQTNVFSHPNFSLNFGIGLEEMFGDTTYEIGGKIVDKDGTTQLWRLPISELKFPLDVGFAGMIAIETNVELYNKFLIKGLLKKNLNSDVSNMEDSDWLNGDEKRDIYSQSETELDALIAEFEMQYSVIRKGKFNLNVGLGYLYENFEFKCKLIRQIYPGNPGYEVPGDGTVGLTYDVTYHIPYVGIGPQLKLPIGKNFGVILELYLSHSPYVIAKDEDNHLVRNIKSVGDSDGYAVKFDFKTSLIIAKYAFVRLAFRGMSIRTNGETDTSFLNEDTGNYEHDHTKDNKITSDQVLASLTLGGRF